MHPGRWSKRAAVHNFSATHFMARIHRSVPRLA